MVLIERCQNVQYIIICCLWSFNPKTSQGACAEPGPSLKGPIVGMWVTEQDLRAMEEGDLAWITFFFTSSLTWKTHGTKMHYGKMARSAGKPCHPCGFCHVPPTKHCSRLCSPFHANISLILSADVNHLPNCLCVKIFLNIFRKRSWLKESFVFSGAQKQKKFPLVIHCND